MGWGAGKRTASTGIFSKGSRVTEKGVQRRGEVCGAVKPLRHQQKLERGPDLLPPKPSLGLQLTEFRAKMPRAGDRGAQPRRWGPSLVGGKGVGHQGKHSLGWWPHHSCVSLLVWTLVLGSRATLIQGNLVWGPFTASAHPFSEYGHIHRIWWACILGGHLPALSSRAHRQVPEPEGIRAHHNSPIALSISGQRLLPGHQ